MCLRDQLPTLMGSLTVKTWFAAVIVTVALYVPAVTVRSGVKMTSNVAGVAEVRLPLTGETATQDRSTVAVQVTVPVLVRVMAFVAVFVAATATVKLVVGFVNAAVSVIDAVVLMPKIGARRLCKPSQR